MAEARHTAIGVTLALGDEEFSGVRVVADLRHLLRADREVLQFGRAGVDDLVRRFRSARRTGDHIAAAHRERFRADAHAPTALENEEHLFVDAMVVERECALARRHGRDVVAELAGAETPSDLPRARVEALRGIARSGIRRGPRRQLDVGDVDDSLCHIRDPLDKCTFLTRINADLRGFLRSCQNTTPELRVPTKIQQQANGDAACLEI